jgi:hypothetical protein
MENRALWHHCSLTRTRPLFRQLLERDPTGGSWLPALVRLGDAGTAYQQRLADSAGVLLPGQTKRRAYNEKCLKRYGLSAIKLEKCFEREFPPPEAVLAWLVADPSRMPRPDLRQIKESTREKKRRYRREELFGYHGDKAREEAVKDALKKIRKKGALASRDKWWAFEGFVEVNCCLETDRLLLFVTCKRDDVLAPATPWYPARDELFRDLEVARANAGGREYALLLITEAPFGPVGDGEARASLPHLSDEDRRDLLSHYLGSTTWREACARLGVEYDGLPKNIAEVGSHLEEARKV